VSKIPTAVANIFMAAKGVEIDLVIMFNAAFAISFYYIKKIKNKNELI